MCVRARVWRRRRRRTHVRVCGGGDGSGPLCACVEEETAADSQGTDRPAGWGKRLDSSVTVRRGRGGVCVGGGSVGVRGGAGGAGAYLCLELLELPLQRELALEELVPWPAARRRLLRESRRGSKG